MNKEILRKIGFGNQVELIENKQCPICKEEIGGFRDEQSKKENTISGLCQACQDRFFE